MPIDDWDQDKVLEQIADHVAESLEVGGEMIRAEAQRNLLRIREPEWGRQYRKLLALYRLTTVTERSPREIEVGIGIPPGKTAYLGWYIEMGSSTAPAHPWLRPAFMNNLREVLNLLRE